MDTVNSNLWGPVEIPVAYNNRVDISRNVGSTVMDLFLTCMDIRECYNSFVHMVNFLAY